LYTFVHKKGSSDDPWARFQAAARLIVGLTVALFLVIMFSNMSSMDAVAMGLFVALVIAIMAIPIGLISVVKWLFRRNTGPDRIYALTNERLLYRSKKSVIDIALEAVPSISLFMSDGTSGTFSFGALFPMWPDVEDAVRVKRLIDEAQKARWKETQA
jgi:hypothetical protein